jgi:hypothetical protein
MELELANVEEDVRPSIITAVAAFSSYGHSGGSASVCIPMLNQLLQFKPISPLTSHPREWQHIEQGIAGDNLTWQSRRRSDAFSKNNGLTYYCLDEERRWLYRVLPWRVWRRLPLWVRYPIHTSEQPR